MIALYLFVIVLLIIAIIFCTSIFVDNVSNFRKNYKDYPVKWLKIWDIVMTIGMGICYLLLVGGAVAAIVFAICNICGITI